MIPFLVRVRNNVPLHQRLQRQSCLLDSNFVVELPSRFGRGRRGMDAPIRVTSWTRRVTASWIEVQKGSGLPPSRRSGFNPLWQLGFQRIANA